MSPASALVEGESSREDVTVSQRDAPTASTGVWSRHLPVIAQVRGYRKSWLPGDMTAAVTVWAIVVPESIAYATIAGMPPQTGLYAAMLPLLAYALLGSARRVTMGPSAAVAALSAATIAPLAAAGSKDFVAMSALLAIVVGLILLLAGVARLGVIADFLSEPVLKGFIVGVALTIALSQVGKLFGIESEGEGFFSEAFDLVGQLPNLSGTTMAVGLSCLVLLFLLERLLPRLPAALVVVVLSILAVTWFDLVDAGVEVAGAIPSGLPAAGVPGFDLATLAALVPGAIGVAIVAYGESMALAKTFAARHGESVDANQELIALGAGNALGGLFGSFTTEASNSRSAAADTAGQKTQVSSLIVVVLLLLTLLFLTDLFTNLPEAALAAIILHAIVGLIRFRPILALRSRNSVDFWAAVTTLLGVLMLDVLAGLMIGVLVSLGGLMSRAAKPTITWRGRERATGLFVDRDQEGVEEIDSVAVVYVSNELFFANAGALREAVMTEVDDHAPHAVVLDAEAVGAIDTTAADMLRQLIQELRDHDIAFAIARMNPEVRRALEAADLDLKDHQYGRTEDAVVAVSPPPRRDLRPGASDDSPDADA